MFGHPVERVEIGNGKGCCKLQSRWEESVEAARSLELAKREAVLRLIVAACAGKAATLRWHELSGKKRFSDFGWKKSNDRKQAFDLALRLNDGDEVGAGLLLAWLQRRAEKLVEEEWPHIHKLAFALLEHRSLTGDQLSAILNALPQGSESS